ncbi:GNAT family N-acetyltransferase [Egibacter rhizosphaerae]|uniref:GNAT family N-acetyltransferase n=1 Tax=Egibacter rhizosphaerae TaxID=1670831 RepID=A0A411YG86_9ACTN|nr:GNAT family N-acetyltransferase [Egibacter rhizosphaerae]QBI20167.1 GNAT family N-acetyltransferase [Egibacter rhizosphaerae]
MLHRLPELRPLTPDEAPAVGELAERVWRAYDIARGRPERPRSTDEQIARRDARLRRAIANDPSSSTGAWDGDALVGIALARRREAFWGLSTLLVHPEHQSAGVGRMLLEAALESGEDAPYGMIVASEDPRATARYRLAGYRLHPCLHAEGTVDPATLPAVPEARAGTGADHEWIHELGRRLRGGGYGPDLDGLGEDRNHLVVVERGDRRGWAFVRDSQVTQLGATDPETGAGVLRAALAATRPDPDEPTTSPPVVVRQLTAEQEWAVDVCLEAGLRLQPKGPLCTRGMDPPVPYLPDGVAF